MGYWHGKLTEKSHNKTDMLTDAPTEEIGCATTHCMAGWVIFETKGGIAFEKKLRLSPYDVEEQFLQKQSEYVNQADDETAAVALAILEKSGWSKHIKNKDFYMDEDDALELIKKLARIEAARERAMRKKVA